MWRLRTVETLVEVGFGVSELDVSMWLGDVRAQGFTMASGCPVLLA